MTRTFPRTVVPTLFPTLFRSLFCGLVAPLALVTTLAACGSDGGDGGGGASSEAAATRSVGSAQTFQAASEEGEGEVALGGALTLYGDLQTMNTTAQAKQAGALATVQAPLAVLEAPLNASCINQQPNGGTITYTDCETGGATFNGTITQAGDQVTIDLTITMDPSAAGNIPAGTPGTVKSVTVTEKGTLTITPQSIDGTLNVDVAIQVDLSQAGLPDGFPGGGTVDVTTSLDAIFDVDLEMACAVGGTLVVKSETGGIPGQTSGSSTITTTASFGPTCGDVTVE